MLQAVNEMKTRKDPVERCWRGSRNLSDGGNMSDSPKWIWNAH